MHCCILKQLKSLSAWSLLFVWLFMGGVALAEQVDLVSETSTQDEQALDAWQLAIKRGQVEAAIDHIPINRVESIAEIADVRFPLSRLLVAESRFRVNSTSTISLFVLLSCYRI